MNQLHSKIIALTIIAVILTAVPGCKKYLDQKPNQKLSTFTSLAELQAVLDDYFIINQSDPASGEASADNYYLTSAIWSAYSHEAGRRMYVWEKDNLFENLGGHDWTYLYDKVYQANTVLDNVDKIKDGDPDARSNIIGSALYIRANCFLQAAVIWSQSYDSISSNTDMGIPLRLNADFNVVSVRASVKETYDQIIQDLKEAIALLPDKPLFVTRPSKPAADALLARTYLFMRKYDSAGKYSDLSLELKNDLMDYNADPEINPASANRFSRYNKEVLIDASTTGIPASLISPLYARVDSALYASYDNNDLRKALFFKTNTDGTFTFVGNYTNANQSFNGITTAEMYLTSAECYARAGKVAEAMNDLNILMKKRWNNNAPFPEFIASDANDALNKISVERRKELITRGVRWGDIKRYNREGANITLERIINSTTYILLPNDLRFALPIPEDVIASSGLPQNPR